MNSMLPMLRRIDKFLDYHIPLLILLLLMLLLRIPNLFEPYWYGDEGIYLTIGTAMRQGERLYAQIIDHKTPIIYYLAMVPNQMAFRVLNIVFMTLATIAFYFFARKLFRRATAIFVSTLIFVIFTTLPWFEGNIPNGELFVMTFVLIGAGFFAYTPLFKTFFHENKDEATPHYKFRRINLEFLRTSPYTNLFLAGFFFGLGVLTKVPGLMDAFGFLSISWFLFATSLMHVNKGWKRWWQRVMPIIIQSLIVIVGLATPILLSIMYFILRGSGQAYLNFGLLYNIHYASNWTLNFDNPILDTLFTLKGKMIVVVTWILCITLARKVLSSRFQFLTTWFGIALFATLLSNRPYPHYFLQVIPPVSLFAGHLLLAGEEIIEKVGHPRHHLSEKIRKLFFSAHMIEVPLMLGAVGIFLGILIVMNVGLYNTSEYYTKFFKLATHQMSYEDYRNSFNWLMADNYAAAKVIRTSPQKHMFIWGDNPMLYAMTRKSPPGRFTVAFHIHDLHVEEETFQDVERVEPDYIVVMKEETPLPHLNQYLNRYYIPNANFEHFVLWKRL